jgi:hypothetical protein
LEVQDAMARTAMKITKTFFIIAVI